jgi:hypothetical protein
LAGGRLEGFFVDMKDSYSEKLKDPRWQKLRLVVMERDGWKCRFCFSDDETLAVHHKRYAESRNPWDSSASDLVTLCEGCHSALHAGTLHKPRPLVDSFYKAVVDGVLANDSDSLIRHIETATDRFLLACDEMDLAIVPLRARLNQMIQKGVEAP